MLKRNALFFFGISLGFFLVGCDTDSNPSSQSDNLALAAQAGGATQSDIPVSFTNDNCSGGQVQVSGVIHFTVNTFVDSQGQRHFELNSNFQGLTGTDASGASYVGTGSGHLSLKSSGQSSEVFTDRSSFSLISQGSAGNLELHFISHYTITPNGDVAVTFSDFQQVCKG